MCTACTNLIVTVTCTAGFLCVLIFYFAVDWCKYNDCLIATGSVDKSIKVWDVRMPQRELLTLLGHGCVSGRSAFPESLPAVGRATRDVLLLSGCAGHSLL